MPLSEALKARLAQRGLLRQDESREYVEEVIAEDYSGDHGHAALRSKGEIELSCRWVPKCANRSNPYHTCSDFCEKRYGLRNFTGNQDVETERKRLRMLRRHPLPDGWKEVADPESNRYYYVNTGTGQSCWLSPSHPKARVYSSSGLKVSKSDSSSRLSLHSSDRDDRMSHKRRSEDSRKHNRRSPDKDRR